MRIVFYGALLCGLMLIGIGIATTPTGNNEGRAPLLNNMAKFCMKPDSGAIVPISQCKVKQ